MTTVERINMLKDVRDLVNGVEHQLDQEFLRRIVRLDDPEMITALLRIYRALHRIHHRTVELRIEIGIPEKTP